MLSESLGGNSKTTLVITCSPSFDNMRETVSTLRFGIRAKSIKNKAKINREWTIPELLKLWKISEKTCEKHSMRIKYLESILMHNDIEVPKIAEMKELNLDLVLDRSLSTNLDETSFISFIPFLIYYS